jgi:hypothetical protein
MNLLKRTARFITCDLNCLWPCRINLSAMAEASGDTHEHVGSTDVISCGNTCLEAAVIRVFEHVAARETWKAYIFHLQFKLV